jgi:bifunctional DNA-binding transcriptional regulator/antitoxin component of YhaV-PrlF toxin-antitoxin module
MSLDEVTFITKVVKVGEAKYTTYRITIPKPLAEAMSLEEGTYIQVHVKKLKIQPISRVKRRGEH